MSDDQLKRSNIDEAVDALKALTPIQVEALTEIIAKFAEERSGELVRDDFLNAEAFEYFTTRLAVHHASSGVPLKKENFEHILERSFVRAGHKAKRPDSMVHRGADLEVNNRFFSLKTEAAKGLRPKTITISKLMEARWIRDLTGTADAPVRVTEHVLSHLQGYERIFILRSYGDNVRVRYDLREIPKNLLTLVSKLTTQDFGKITRNGGTAADVKFNGRKAFRLVLDGSVEKITITGLDVELCPLHAWWELGKPG